MSDVCLILEGTYPYVMGGVSSCVYQLIKNTPYIDYSILYIGSNLDTDAQYRYPIPDNVKIIKEVYLFDYQPNDDILRKSINFNTDLLYEFHKASRKQKALLFPKVFNEIIRPRDPSFNSFDILKSREAWNYLSAYYKERFHDIEGPSFIDYFYTWRFTHYPLFKIFNVELPKAKLYHSLSTGYAGLLGAVAKSKSGSSFMLTEHGIYSHEREIEIYQSEWIFNAENDLQVKGNLSIFKEWWIKLFHFMGQIAYEQADLITTLYEGNRAKQVKYGADANKIEIIANGVDYKLFSSIKREENQDGNIHIALIGRVVPIKDIKTFIKAIHGLNNKLKNKSFRVSIIGPYDKDIDYYEECKRLVTFFNLNDHISFTGKVDVTQYYGKIDLVVLSSISEGQPMVILEAFACGIPCVATDVGSCRELIYGMSTEDRELGKAGEVVSFGKPEELGQAMYSVVTNSVLRDQMAKTAKLRAEKYYREDITVKNYVKAYNKLMSTVK